MHYGLLVLAARTSPAASSPQSLGDARNSCVKGKVLLDVAALCQDLSVVLHAIGPKCPDAFHKREGQLTLANSDLKHDDRANWGALEDSAVVRQLRGKEVG